MAVIKREPEPPQVEQEKTAKSGRIISRPFPQYKLYHPRVMTFYDILGIPRSRYTTSPWALEVLRVPRTE